MATYVFDPDVVHECSLAAIGHPKPQMFDVFAQAMEREYPGVLDHSQPWLYSIAGGAMIQMKLYYASLTEYIMIWGTPIGSEGHSGRHLTGFWDTVIDGETSPRMTWRIRSTISSWKISRCSIVRCRASWGVMGMRVIVRLLAAAGGRP